MRLKQEKDAVVDMWDPNTWVTEPHAFRIYADDNASVWAEIDEVDYHAFIRWRWHILKPHPGRNGSKQYFIRNSGSATSPGRKHFLHVEIMRATGIAPPSELHKLVDHIDGNEWNCLRNNLRWATKKMNRRNIGSVGASLRY